MLELETPYYLQLFKNEFITAKKVLNPDFEINDEPSIRIDNDIVSLSDCKVGENVSFVIPIYNDGKYPLKDLEDFYKLFLFESNRPYEGVCCFSEGFCNG